MIGERRGALRLLALGALLCSSGGCGGGARDSATADTAVLQSAAPPDTARTDSAAATVARPTGDTGAVALPTVVLRADSAAGDSLYHRGRGCQSCHGVRGEGVAGLGPSLADSVWLHGDGSPAFVQGVILAGIAEPRELPRGMPAFASHLTPVQAARVAAYVVALSRPDLVADSATVGRPAAAPDTQPPP